MQRVTITIDDELMTELDRIIEARGYQNRSEAIRDLARAGIRQAAETHWTPSAIASQRWSTSTTTMPGSSPSGSPTPSTTTTNCRSLPCTPISTTTAAWR